MSTTKARTDRPFKDVPADDLETQIAELEREFQTLRKSRGRHREDAHDRIDAMRSEAAGALAQAIEHVRFAVCDRAVTLGEIGPVAALWTIVHDDELTAALHAAVDAPSRGVEKLAEGSRDDWTAERGRVRSEINGREAELIERQAEATLAAAKRQAAELRATVTA